MWTDEQGCVPDEVRGYADALPRSLRIRWGLEVPQHLDGGQWAISDRPCSLV